MAIKVAINGFGRIGRNIVRAALHDKALDFVAVNDLTDPKTLGHLLKFDSVLGNLHDDVKVEGDVIKVAGRSLKVLSAKDPATLPWKDLGVDVVVESTGHFTKRDGAEKHLKAGAKKVVISAPATDEDVTIVMGVNEKSYDPAKHNIISNASCTTNCLAPVVKVIIENFGFVTGQMTTIHSYTNDQVVLDFPHKDLRRARAAGLNIIPTTTGAAKAVALVLPQVKGRLDGLAIRVPTSNVSLIDLVCNVEKTTTKEAVNAALKMASEGALKGILAYTDLELVSSDFKGTNVSSTVDGLTTKVMEGKLVKVLAWYDNEWGYSNRVNDLVKYVAGRGL
ncbi:MAG: type I glyceraldehyde-3-phosphate dehydrogenase [Nitrospinae bacterium]|nr:type I glyceraldehyde-3-phosphate dehydrogenase [Nitrospinota bacterium]